ncbi:MAG: toll/interleukin-1 receptor domain-containing protein, partial [Hydrogenophilaceae bacterium]|nr:toll/interleukin-1 receptor domain-containing protein [Hydrogenophilaceae bacterium]
MTVHIVHAPADQAVAEALQTYLERRGQFVDRESGEMGFRPLMNADVVVMLWSKETPFAPFRLAMEKRALDAWAEGRLVLVKLDPHFAPVGLRDLPFVDATFETQRDLVAWPEIAKRVQEAARPPASLDSRSGDMSDAMRAPAPQAPSAPPAPARKRGGGALFWVVAVLAILAGAGAVAVMASVWLVNRIGAAPGSLADLKAGVDAFAAQYGLPGGVGFHLAAGLAGLALCFIVYALVRRPRRGGAARPRRRGAE